MSFRRREPCTAMVSGVYFGKWENLSFPDITNPRPIQEAYLRQSPERAFCMVLSLYAKSKPIGFILFCSLLQNSLILGYGSQVSLMQRTKNPTLGLGITPASFKPISRKGLQVLPTLPEHLSVVARLPTPGTTSEMPHKSLPFS